jgi:alkanesulfonate monooxygenase SsuD/methylene tetrahydromethanopterin reductase-like flavin-dependent oxidoreductase (luciferase family)
MARPPPGFGAGVRGIKDAFDRGGREATAKVVPDELVDAVALAGTAQTCLERVAEYRRAGPALPIISPRVSGPDGRKMAMTAIRACAP